MWPIDNQYKVTIIEDYCTRYLIVPMYISFLHFALIGYSITIKMCYNVCVWLIY